MFIKIKDFYNPKIDYKMLYFLNPKLDTTINYYETKRIYKSDIDYESEQGKWFKKLKKFYDFLLANELDINKILNYSSNIFNTIMYKSVVDKIHEEYLNIKNRESTYVATWFLIKIISKEPLKSYSEELAILIFNSIIKKGGYIPFIFKRNYIMYIKKIINLNSNTNYVKEILSIHNNLSTLYNRKYKNATKKDIIEIIENNKNFIRENLNIKKVWIFGSFVRNEQNEFSDIDLYIEFINNKSEYKTKSVEKYFSELLGRAVDILVEGKEYKNFSDNAINEREVILDDSE